jgi:hypothetical protein
MTMVVVEMKQMVYNEMEMVFSKINGETEPINKMEKP